MKLQNKVIKIGKRHYNYSRDDKNNEILTRKDKIGDKEIDVVIKNGNEENNEVINKYITDILSELYIRRKLKEM
mgnify:CR=1 FL=1